MSYLFSSESVSEGHPDKVADQISDAILDQFLAYDPKARCAIESFVTTGQVVIMGEVRSDVYIDLQTMARKTIKRIGYTKAEYQFDGDSCGILSAIHEQSADINRGVDNGNEDEQGAGDQVKQNSYWLSIINGWRKYGIDFHSNFEKLVNAQTPESISAFVKEILKSGNRAEVIMLPAE